MSAHARKSFPATPARRRRHRIHSDLPAVFRAGLRPDQLQHSFAHVAVVQRCRCRGARAAIAVDPSDAGYESLAEARARDELLARLDWMPAAWRANLQPCAGNGQYADYVSATSRIEVCVQYPYGDPGKAIIPVLSFPGIGAIPNLPQTLKASANLLL